MTLDLSKFMENSIQTQAAVQHFEMNSKTVKVDEIPNSVSSLIKKQYGDIYLQDANYVSFFWGGFNEGFTKKLFNVVDKALGKSANRLTESDFKKLVLNSGDADGEDEQQEDNTEDVEDAEETEEIEDVEDIEDVDSDDEEQEMQAEIEDVLKEDDESLEASKETKYIFLKITTK